MRVSFGRFWFHLAVMGKKIALVCIRFLAVGQTPLIQFVLLFGVLGAYTLGQFSLRPFRDNHSNFLASLLACVCAVACLDHSTVDCVQHCSLQLALLLFCVGGLLRRMAKCEKGDPGDNESNDGTLLGNVILVLTFIGSMLMILWAVRPLPILLPIPLRQLLPFSITPIGCIE